MSDSVAHRLASCREQVSVCVRRVRNGFAHDLHVDRNSRFIREMLCERLQAGMKGCSSGIVPESPHGLPCFVQRHPHLTPSTIHEIHQHRRVALLEAPESPGRNVGFPYASFLLGLVDNATVNAVQDPQWRKKTWGLFLQDTWKVSRRFTLDYGLRWDLQTQGQEIHDCSSMFGPTIPNPAAGGLPGGIVYEGFGPGRCDCRFTSSYPYAIGPRLGAAWQIDEKTVLRSGFGITYTNLPTYGYFTNSAILGVGFDQRVWENPGFGEPAATLRDGLQHNVTIFMWPVSTLRFVPRLGS